MTAKVGLDNFKSVAQQANIIPPRISPPLVPDSTPANSLFADIVFRPKPPVPPQNNVADIVLRPKPPVPPQNNVADIVLNPKYIKKS